MFWTAFQVTYLIVAAVTWTMGGDLSDFTLIVVGITIASFFHGAAEWVSNR